MDIVNLLQLYKEINMKVIGFDHFAINTVDFESSLVFYRDVLGFKQLDTVDTGDFSSTNLIAPGGSIVELLDKHKKSNEATSDNHARVDHIAFNVDDVEGFEKALKSSGFEIVASCTELEDFNTKVVKCKDPNGIIIAFRKNLR